jgi:hypothetical protein
MRIPQDIVFALKGDAKSLGKTSSKIVGRSALKGFPTCIKASIEYVSRAPAKRPCRSLNFDEGNGEKFAA